MASDKVLILDDENFASEVLESDIPVLVDFWAQWCGPCRMVAPILDKLADEFEGRLKIGKLNVDESRQTAGHYDIMSIPALLIFKNGEVDDKIIGAQPESKLRSRIEQSL